MSRADDIEAQAAAWVARADRGNCGRDPALAAWLAADPRHRAAYLRLAEAWRRSERLERLRPTDGVIDPDLLAPLRSPGRWRLLRNHGGRLHTASPSARGSRRRAPRAFGWGAAAAGLAAAAFVLWWVLAPAGAQAYRTLPGGLYRVVLADGSSIILNADTDVSVRYTASSRRVTLVRGEAQFLVEHDAHRPFEVRANDHIVRDLGTHFDVRLDAEPALDVLVTEGRVVMMPVGGSETQPAAIGRPTISAGELALVDARQITIRRLTPTEISRRLSWKDRELDFQGQTLRQAVAEFNHYNSPKLVIESPSLDSLRIGGNFDALDTDSFVAALKRSFGISARMADGTIYLYGPVTG